MNADFSRSGLLSVIFFLLTSPTVRGDDWAQWRGPNRDAQSQETGLSTQWPASGPPLAWKAEGLGGGFSSVSVANGRIVTLGDFDDGNYVVAISEADGSPVWKTKIGDAGGHKKYKGPRSTPTVDGGQVFVLNQHSDLVCLNEKTGESLWSVNLVERFGGEMMSGWKYSESPLVDGRQVICTPGGSDGTMLALNRETGEKIWQTSSWTDTAGYSSVIIATIGGKRQYVQLTGESVAGVDTDSGEVLWRAEREGKTAVVPTPVVADDVVFVTSGYGVGCNAFVIKNDDGTWSTEELYANQEIANHHGGVVLVGAHVYGSSGGVFRCLNVTNGELAFEGRSVGKGATVYADGHLYLRGESGDVALIEATPEGLREKSRFEQPDRSDEKAWAHPVISDGKLYLRDQDILLCFDLRAK
ncbi:PQQ-binding-like beta-propeller repeat protein [Rubripirellula reticaptiva]|uniref:Outer membrane biogenesis protein BamB n=1 Tax=Rubripirellula reticaptiva TaxID=2528013 RepID=A0A5C6EEU7_9BACT|nr:PQQ-binding-like beta-propeller repeat protein [Rubripirellula reticaptiva]TWU46954.1 outer membrane biogenesis protein BamB [Rubripirellula reticaptiva]